jgi:hypothetical protein
LGNQRSKSNGLRLGNPNTISLKENMKKGMKKNMIEGDLVILGGKAKNSTKRDLLGKLINDEKGVKSLD